MPGVPSGNVGDNVIDLGAPVGEVADSTGESTGASEELPLGTIVADAPLGDGVGSAISSGINVGAFVGEGTGGKVIRGPVHSLHLGTTHNQKLSVHLQPALSTSSTHAS